jgi:hypothetical protein
MADWPQVGTPAPIMITPFSAFALGVEYGAVATVTPISVAHGTINLARFFPFVIPEPILVMKLFWHNGGTASGNVDVGIFSEDGKKIISTGAQAQGTISVLQEFDIADTVIGRGRFYLGISASSATATFLSNAVPLQLAKAFGWVQMATCHPLVDATFAAYATAIQPVFGLSGRVLVV